MPAHISSTTPPLRWSFAHHCTAHLDQRRPQRIKALDIEFRCGVETSGGDGPRRRQHPVAADKFAGVVLADQQVIAVLVEAVGVQTAGVAIVLQGETGFGGEHVIAKALRGLDERRVGGQQEGVARSVRGLRRRICGYEYGSSAHGCTVAEPHLGTASWR